MDWLVGFSRLGVEVASEQVQAADARSEADWLQFLYAHPHLLLDYANACEEAGQYSEEQKRAEIARLSKDEGWSIPPTPAEYLEKRKQSDLIMAEVCSLSGGFGVLSTVLWRMRGNIEILRSQAEKDFAALFTDDEYD